MAKRENRQNLMKKPSKNNCFLFKIENFQNFQNSKSFSFLKFKFSKNENFQKLIVFFLNSIFPKKYLKSDPY